MKNKNGFTLVELIAVIVIIVVIFLFAFPKISTLINEGENTNIKLVEERIIESAKEYAYNYSDNFFDTLKDEGDIKIITKEELLNSKLVSSSDIEQIEEMLGVKVELTENDQFVYTIVNKSN